ncbi:MAG: alpha/beta hydrolase [Flavobacteriales bacterium]
MSNWQHQMAMTYYRMMKGIRSKVELDPTQIRTYMDIVATLALPSIGFDVFNENIGGVKMETVKHKSVEKGKVLFFIHGGAFAFGSAKTHRPAACFLSKRVHSTVYLPQYRTTPEYNYPIPLEDCIKAWKGVVEKHPDEEIYLIGDSAGGNLSAALTMFCRDNGLKLPNKLVLLSPWLDLNEDSASCQINAHEESIFDKEDLMVYSSHYLAGRSPKDPLISPLRGEVKSFPKTMIQVAKNELLYHDSINFEQKLRDAEVETVLDEEDALFHSWQLVPDYLPAAKKSLEKVAQFLNS